MIDNIKNPTKDENSAACLPVSNTKVLPNKSAE